MLVIGLYTVLILTFTLGLIRLSKTTIKTHLPQQKFSIVVPFRNEEKNLPALLSSIAQLNYSQENFEVLLIDDASEDNSVDIIKKWQSKISNLSVCQNKHRSNSPKKDAVQIGIKHSKFDWILATDADCILPKNWLHSYNTLISQKKSLFIAGPIKLQADNSLVHQYQFLDNLSLLGVTMGSFGIHQPMMCNAANMGFDKHTYVKITNNHRKIVSGDDVFTLEYFAKKHPKQTHYIKSTEAIVTTKPEADWKAIIQQRIRWAAKSTHYQNLFTKLVGLLVLVTQLTLVLYLLKNPFFGTLLLMIKLGIDYILILSTAQQLQQKIYFKYYLVVAFVYPFINSYIGIKSLFGGYTWKNRSFKR